MAKIVNRLDISFRQLGRQPSRSRSAIAVPGYSLYGDTAVGREWFVNIEPLGLRARAEDWVIAPHTHPKFAQVVLVSRGSGKMTIDGDSLSFAAPAILVVPPFHIHSFDYEEGTEGSVLTIEVNYLGELLSRAPELAAVLEIGGAHRLSASALKKVRAAVTGLKSELGNVLAGSRIAMEMHLLQFLLTMLRDLPREGPGPKTARGELVDRFLLIVEERYWKQPNMEEIAKELGVTAAQLRLACKAIRGVSPLAILQDRLMAEAKRCLSYTAMGIGEISYALGFDDAAYFSRAFANKVGMPPSEFRRTLAA